MTPKSPFFPPKTALKARGRGGGSQKGSNCPKMCFFCPKSAELPPSAALRRAVPAVRAVAAGRDAEVGGTGGAFWVQMGPFWGRKGNLGGFVWGLSLKRRDFLGGFGAVWGHFSCVLGWIWGHFGVDLGRFGCGLGWIWGISAAVWGGFGGILGWIWGILGEFPPILSSVGAFGVRSDAILYDFGLNSPYLGADLGHFGAVCCLFLALPRLLPPVSLHFSPPNLLFLPKMALFSPKPAVLAPTWSSCPHNGTPTTTSCTPNPPSSALSCPRRTKRYRRPQNAPFCPQSDPPLPKKSNFSSLLFFPLPPPPQMWPNSICFWFWGTGFHPTGSGGGERFSGRFFSPLQK